MLPLTPLQGRDVLPAVNVKFIKDELDPFAIVFGFLEHGVEGLPFFEHLLRQLGSDGQIFAFQGVTFFVPGLTNSFSLAVPVKLVLSR